MADSDFPIDINYAKIADWLVDRKLLQRDWRPRLAAIQEQAQKAAQELSPEHARLLRAPWEVVEGQEGEEEATQQKEKSDAAGAAAETVPPSSVVDHPAALRVRDALVSDPETAKKSLLGAWQGQAGTWDKLCRAYARGGGGSAPGSLPVAEAALLLSRLVDFEVPALRASAARGHQQLRDLERRAADCSKQAAAAARDFEAECLALGVSPSGCGCDGGGVDGELRALVARELRPLLRRAAEALRSEEVGLAVGYYAAFVRYAHGGGGRGEKEAAAEELLLLPALAAVRAAPSADLEEEAAPTPSAAAPAPAASDSDVTTTEISWEIDVSSSGAEAEAEAVESGGGCGGAEAASGGIAWDIEVEEGGVGVGGDDDGDAHSSAAAAAAAPEHEKPPLGILSKLASDPSARASLGDDLAELSAFLGQRLAAAKLGGGGNGGGGGAAGMMATAADLPPDAPAELSSLSSLEALQLALSRLREAEEALSGERASLLLLLLLHRQGGGGGGPAGGAGSGSGSRGAERVASRLRARAGAEGKFRRAAAAASARAAVVRAELAADAGALRRAAAAARDAKRRAEEGVAAILGGGNRKVSVVGREVSAVLAAAERGC